MQIRKKDIDFILSKKWDFMELLNSLDLGFVIEAGDYEYDCGGYRLIKLFYGDWTLLGSLCDNVVRFVKIEYKEKESEEF